MDFNSGSPYKPWVHQQNHSLSTLVARGMEIAIPPGRAPPRPTSHHYTNAPLPRPSSHNFTQPLPFIPSNIPSNRYWNESTMTWETPIYREMTASRCLTSIDTKPQPMHSLIRTRCTLQKCSREGLRTLMPPPTLSSHEILQLTGFDPRFEMPLPEQYQQINQPRPVSPVPSSYSESLYDQAENSLDIEKRENFSSLATYHQPKNYHDIVQEEESQWSSGDSSPNPEHVYGGIVQPFYKISGQMADAISSVTSFQHKDRPTKAQSRQIKQNEITTIRDLLAEERARQSGQKVSGF
jgi:hypothetical protein